MSQARFAHFIGLSPSYVCELENDKRNLNLSTLEKIAERLDLNVFDLMTAEPEVEIPRIPDKVADFIEKSRMENNSLMYLFKKADLRISPYYDPDCKEAYWIYLNDEEAAKAFIFGYEVEEEE